MPANAPWSVQMEPPCLCPNQIRTYPQYWSEILCYSWETSKHSINNQQVHQISIIWKHNPAMSLAGLGEIRWWSTHESEIHVISLFALLCAFCRLKSSLFLYTGFFFPSNEAKRVILEAWGMPVTLPGRKLSWSSPNEPGRNLHTFKSVSCPCVISTYRLFLCKCWGHWRSNPPDHRNICTYWVLINREHIGRTVIQLVPFFPIPT